MEPMTRLTSTTLVLPEENIDTDQIIPARYLTTTASSGFADAAFRDWRFDANDQPIGDCVLNEPDAPNRKILVAGANFGCGSSREHAPWALRDFGFRVVVSSRIADIFSGNARNCGVLPVVVSEEDNAWLLANPGAEVTVDVEQGTIEFNDRKVAFELDEFSRYRFMNGQDVLGYILAQGEAIDAYEQRVENP
ncbi:MAG: 3-isopropylmalate dehydratase small subunit [Xanthomonadales bacterium]|nr:3-isopropylmalate dehydratase small subunit [Xanthomonadales bacterium]